MSGLRAIIFDLDGTLVDTLRDIADAMNHALEAHGLPTHGYAAYRMFIGEGVTRLAERATVGTDAPTDVLVEAFRSRYRQTMLEHSAPYPGIDDLLRQLESRGIPLAVLSNKPHRATCQIVARLFGDVAFGAVLGQREGVPSKPDPHCALAITRTLAVPASACGLIGDTPIDIRTARAAGMTPVGVTWGFRDPDELQQAGATRLISTPHELLALL